MLLKAILLLLRFLPLWLLHCLGYLAGWGLFLLPNKFRWITLCNLTLCFPEMTVTERNRLARKSLTETARTALELGKTWLAPCNRMSKLVVAVRGGELLESALNTGKGVILIVPHLGSWELFGLNITRYGNITSLYKPPKQHALGEAIKGFRSRSGATLVPTNKQGVMLLLKALKAGEMVGILPDQQPERGSGVFAPFFGVDALTMTLVPKLAARTGASVVCGYVRRLPGSVGFEMVFLPAEPGIDDQDPVRAATALNRSVEKCVREAPAQYQWEYKRFKERPEGDARRLYARGS
ncbi:MAG: lysophospholipid acyltransferase family protein [Pseudomonadales bacterium]|nr:lysophospholipid acyltransferase family protein [Pseudomonadales bacterium]